ncbi:MAG: hypothetical protein HKN16_05690 [Saprospiraceae bacterium]|nr:hypothetical protein [Saprospiraceae bacterium]
MANKFPIKVFRTPRHQRFEYNPRYWNPDKEERENRLKRAQQMKEEGNVEGMKARISTGLRRGGARDTDYRRKMVQKANFRLMTVLISLIVITITVIWIFLPELITALFGTGS